MFDDMFDSCENLALGYKLGYKKGDEVYAIIWEDNYVGNVGKGTVVGDVSYRYDYPCLAVHLDTMEDKDDWIELDVDFIGRNKSEIIEKLRKTINTLQNLFNRMTEDA